jgi:hypothetical protein
VRATAGVIYQRVLQEDQAGVAADDLFSSTEEGTTCTSRSGMPGRVSSLSSNPLDLNP